LFALWACLPLAQAGPAAIASPEPHATEAGIAILNRGGNAVDATIAVAFVLAVTLPDAGNIGGGGFMTLLMDGEPGFLDYRETAPAAATQNMYLDDAGEVIENLSLVGHRASGVPGTVAGLWAAHQRHGNLPWRDLLQPAITLAEDGFVTPDWLAGYIDDARGHLGEHTNFLDYFGAANTGTLFRQPELAKTLQRIAEEGRNGFYGGITADLIEKEMRQGGGLIRKDDLAAYEARWRTPLLTNWRDYTLVTAPPPSSGGFAIVQYLLMRDRLAAEFGNATPMDPRFIHLKAEIEKRIFADRAQHLGDPDFVDVPIDRLIDETYLASRIEGISASQVSPTPAVKAGVEPIHTTHFSILDHHGNAVSNTYTLNTDFGSGVVVRGAGFLLNNEMDDFSAAPGKPNYYGVVGDRANAIEPCKRMLSSMAPSLLLRGKRSGDYSVAMVVGAMGGSTIFTTVYQTITNVVDFAMSVDEAQAAPRVHHQLIPDQLITYSPSTPPPQSSIDSLIAMGYRVEPHFFEFGNVQLIWVDGQGQVSAASDPRFAGVSKVVMPVTSH